MHSARIPAEKEPAALWPRLALFSAALIWGSSFVMMKNAVVVFPVNVLLTCRFSLSCLLLCLLFRRRLKLIDRDYLIKTAPIGLCLYLAYTFQTIGIRTTTPGKNAFLTAAYVVIVPFLHWFAGKRKPTIKNLSAAFVCLAGVGLISLLVPEEAVAISRFSIEAGDAWTLLGSLFFAAHMVFLGLYSPGKDPVLITTLQFGYCAVFFGLAALLAEGLPRSPDPSGWLSLLYLAVFCTALCCMLQNYAQKYVSPSSASLLLSLEAVFGVAFSLWLYGERLTPRLTLGFVLVFAAILISEAQWKRRKSP